jgi:hypothetical protein
MMDAEEIPAWEMKAYWEENMGYFTAVVVFITFDTIFRITQLRLSALEGRTVIAF